MNTSWIALLRGVNVGGITIRSAELAQVFRNLGFDEVRTVLASGNVAFGSTKSGVTLKKQIEGALHDRFGYDAWIVLVTRAQVVAAIDAFPFDAEDSARQPWVIFGSDDAALDELAAAAASFDPGTDPVIRGEGVVYWNPAKGSSTDTPFAKVLARAKYKATTTNRNLRTLRRIVG
jgi:uncharacterized protein (DUF1697 family)